MVKKYGEFTLVANNRGFVLQHNGIWILDASLFVEKKDIRIRTKNYISEGQFATGFIENINDRGDNEYAVQFNLKSGITSTYDLDKKINNLTKELDHVVEKRSNLDVVEKRLRSRIAELNMTKIDS